MSHRHRRTLPLLLLVSSLVACGGEDAADGPVETVTILEPAEGATLDGPDLRVVLDISGMEIRPAGDATPHSGHHHLYLDHDLTDPKQPIPAIPGQIIHMGDGSSEYVFKGVGSGEHRVIAVVGDYVHVPIQPWVVDTVHITVR